LKGGKPGKAIQALETPAALSAPPGLIAFFSSLQTLVAFTTEGHGNHPLMSEDA